MKRKTYIINNSDQEITIDTEFNLKDALIYLNGIPLEIMDYCYNGLKLKLNKILEKEFNVLTLIIVD